MSAPGAHSSKYGMWEIIIRAFLSEYKILCKCQIFPPEIKSYSVVNLAQLYMVQTLNHANIIFVTIQHNSIFFILPKITKPQNSVLTEYDMNGF